MQKLQGIAVSPGVALGDAFIIDNEGFRITRRFIQRSHVDPEIERLDLAIDEAADDIEQSRDTVNHLLGEQYGAIFSAHVQMLRDPKLHQQFCEMIRTRHYSAEYAVSRVLRSYARMFQDLESSYLAERAHDIFDIEKSLLRSLLGHEREDLSQLGSPVVILAHNLTPGDTARLDRENVRGFVTEVGGAGGHTAIVAKGLEIPAVVGTGSFLADVSGGDRVIIDGDQGLVILQPDEETIAWYQHEAEEHESLAVQLETLHALPAETTDGVRINLSANIEFPYEVAACVHRGADGIGLYRTEFLYLGNVTEPDEEAHFQAYAEVVQAMADRPVVIRTIDLGADKLSHEAQEDPEPNPCLGMRSIRLSLRNLPLFRTQLRAILRASALGNVRVMFPLISTLFELRQAKMVLADVMEDLDEEGVDFDREIPVGMMVEVPAAVMMLDHFLPEVSFISIGTNDLIQYTLAVDRSNKEVAGLYHATEPAVLRMIAHCLNQAKELDVPVNVCGQMSGTPEYLMLLLGMGLRAASVPPGSVPGMKKLCRSVNIPQCEGVASRVLTMDNAREIDKYLREQLRKAVPELLF